MELKLAAADGEPRRSHVACGARRWEVSTRADPNVPRVNLGFTRDTRTPACSALALPSHMPWASHGSKNTHLALSLGEWSEARVYESSLEEGEGAESPHTAVHGGEQRL